MKEAGPKPKRRKFLRRFCWTIAILITLTVLFYTVERWRGARAWAKVEAYLKEEGESLEFNDLRPPSIRDRDNLCAIPLLASLTDFTTSNGVQYNEAETRERFLKMVLPRVEDIEPPPLPDIFDARQIDLEAWANYLAAAEGFEVGEGKPTEKIHNAFTKFETDFSEIADAAESRPGARFPLEVGESFLERMSVAMPYLNDVMNFSKFLTVKGAAAIVAGDTTTAKRCMVIQFGLADAMGAEPFLIRHLVEIVILNHACSILREGLLASKWDDSNLRWIEEKLKGIDLFQSGAQAVRGEMVGLFLPGIKFLKSASGAEWGMMANDMGVPTFSIRLGAWLIPDGWLDQNAAKGCAFMYKNSILPLKNRDLSGIGSERFIDEFGSTTPYNFLVRLILPGSSSVMKKTGQGQAMLESARLACAVERFRLKGGGIPESLESLTSEFIGEIPPDPMTGEPLLYSRVDKGYRIYSVGLNGTDDGGTIVKKENGRVDREEGDWVWEIGN